MKKFLFVAIGILPLSMPLLSAQNATPVKVAKVEKPTKAKQSTNEKEGINAPTAVKTAFKKRFPTVTKVSFDREKNGEYEAEFKVNGKECSANFTAEGVWGETENEIDVIALPANITQAIAAKYPKAKIVGAAKIETANKGTQYEADLKTGMKKKEVLLNESGNFID